MGEPITISQHLFRADQTIEIHEPKGDSNGFTTYIKDGEAIIFPSIAEFIRYVVLGEVVKRIYADEDDLETIYSEFGDFYALWNSEKYGNAID